MRDIADRIIWIAVANGQQALVFANHDTAENPCLGIVSKKEFDNPPTREQGAERPKKHAKRNRMGIGRALSWRSGQEKGRSLCAWF